MKQLHARIRITFDERPPPKERYRIARRNRYRRRLTLMGLRPESIRKYLVRGFGPTNAFVRATRSEMAGVIADLERAKYAARHARRHAQ